VGRDAEPRSELALLEQARAEELRVLRRDADLDDVEALFEQDRLAGVLSSRGDRPSAP